MHRLERWARQAELAERLVLSEKTVKTQVGWRFMKLGVRDQCRR